MKKCNITLIVLAFVTIQFTEAGEKDIGCIKNDIISDKLFEHPKYKRWIDFWELKIPEVKYFVIEKNDTIGKIFSNKIDLEKWFLKRRIREFTLNFSAKKDYVTDVYSHMVFENNKDSLYAIGGDVDPSFEIVNIKDSIIYHLTLGPYSFFDESVWLGDNTCYILGFSFDDSRENVANAYCKIIILEWDFEKGSLIVCSSQRFPFNKELMKISTYMNYLYREIK